MGDALTQHAYGAADEGGNDHTAPRPHTGNSATSSKTQPDPTSDEILALHPAPRDGSEAASQRRALGTRVPLPDAYTTTSALKSRAGALHAQRSRKDALERQATRAAAVGALPPACKLYVALTGAVLTIAQLRAGHTVPASLAEAAHAAGTSLAWVPPTSAPKIGSLAPFYGAARVGHASAGQPNDLPQEPSDTDASAQTSAQTNAQTSVAPVAEHGTNGSSGKHSQVARRYAGQVAWGCAAEAAELRPALAAAGRVLEEAVVDVLMDVDVYAALAEVRTAEALSYADLRGFRHVPSAAAEGTDPEKEDSEQDEPEKEELAQQDPEQEDPRAATGTLGAAVPSPASSADVASTVADSEQADSAALEATQVAESAPVVGGDGGASDVRSVDEGSDTSLQSALRTPEVANFVEYVLESCLKGLIQESVNGEWMLL